MLNFWSPLGPSTAASASEATLATPTKTSVLTSAKTSSSTSTVAEMKREQPLLNSDSAVAGQSKGVPTLKKLLRLTDGEFANCHGATQWRSYIIVPHFDDFHDLICSVLRYTKL